MNKRKIGIAAVCAAAVIGFLGCGKEAVWSNLTEDNRESVTDDVSDVTEINNGKTNTKSDRNAETETETDTGADTEINTDTATNRKNEENTDGKTETGEKITVYICGAVTHPGVYELPAGARVFQAIEAAGGLLEDADLFLINQAKKLEDGEQIRILTCDEAVQASEGRKIPGFAFSGSTSEETAEIKKININTADAEQLMTLPGIGRAKADAILEYREKNGGFQKIEDIMNIAGIKEAVFSKIKDQITVS